MKNLNYYPFERNKFFYGKLLTVADFELEQKYMNDKRRYLSRYLFGCGVICGLNTYNVDDNSIMIEAGSAIDSYGREIIVNESVIRKLSGIDGFDSVTKNTLYLCLEYGENLSDPVYSMAHTSGDASGNSSEYNRIREGFRLFVTDEEPNPPPAKLIDDFICKKIVYSDKNVTVSQSVPRIVSGLKPFDIIVDIEKHNPKASISAEYVIDTPYFDAVDGTSSLTVSYDEQKLGAHDNYSMSYSLIPRSSVQTEAVITIAAKNVKLSVQNEFVPIKENIAFDIYVYNTDITEMIERKYFSISTEVSSGKSANNNIYLSEIDIFRSNNAYIIEAVKAMPFKQYINNPQLSYTKHQLEKFFPAVKSLSTVSALPNTNINTSNNEVQKPQVLFSSGIIEIPLGFNPKPKQKFYSEEIMHGLGKGNVVVVLAIESPSLGEKLVRGNFSTFGNPEVFQGSEFITALPKCDVAAITYEERGTFVAGILLNESTSLLSLKIRWNAYKDISSVLPQSAADDNSCLFIKPDTVVVGPRETAYFKTVFYNTEEAPCHWSVADENGGKIEANGVYTAPNKEGVYEICVESISDPSLKASAFVVVKEKGVS